MPKRFFKMKQAGEKIAALTAYDAVFARAVAQAGADFILVGDSLGMILQGNKDTLGVRVADVAYHLRAAAAGAPDAFIVGDMPFGSYQCSPQQAFANAAKLMRAGAAMVKMEGGEEMAETTAFLTARGVPVCAHVGLLPQQTRAEGGFGVRGRESEAAARICQDARAQEAAGAGMLVLELLPQALAARISGEVKIPTIGIGSGAQCDGQILVLHDMLGIGEGKRRFVRNFLTAQNPSVAAALAEYVRAVKSGEFPTAENAFN